MMPQSTRRAFRCSAALLFYVLMLAGSPAAFAAGDIRIVEIGIEGYFSTTAPTAVTVEVHNPAPTAVEALLSFEIQPENRGERRTDVISQVLQLQAGERRTHSVPILPDTYKTKLTARLHDKNERLLGEETQILEKMAGAFIVILCREAARCQSAENGIKSAGTIQEQAQKQQLFTFARLHKPLDKWWKYLIAKSVVLADSMALMPEQQRALEEYVRQGGTLVDLSGASGNVLDEYRSAIIPQPVSKGNLYRTTDLNNAQLRAHWSGDVGVTFPYFSSVADNRAFFRSRLATAFTFPRLRWLLAWFAIYILIVGPLNFAVLRRMKRLELGWLTIPILALLFAVLLYWWGGRDRPREFGVDEIAMYWLDDRSSTAGAEFSVRVFSPERRQLTVSVPTDAVFTSNSALPGGFGLSGIFLGRGESLTEGRRLRLGSRQEMQLDMARWSFQDLDYVDVRELPGTIRLRSEKVLSNQTGKRFREAIYLGIDGGVHSLGAVGPGEIRIEATPGISLQELRTKRERGEKLGDSILLDFLISPPYRSELKDVRQLFLGLSEEPVLNAELYGIAFNRKNYAITVARLGGEND